VSECPECHAVPVAGVNWHMPYCSLQARARYGERELLRVIYALVQDELTTEPSGNSRQAWEGIVIPGVTKAQLREIAEDAVAEVER
jgi:hypothetical protein